MGRPRAGSSGLTDLQARAQAWADRSCLDQQQPRHVTDKPALNAVAKLLSAASQPDRRQDAA